MKSTLPSPERQRRLRAAPLGLVLLGWGLGAGPLAHSVLAHGEPILQDGADRSWVAHAGWEGGHQQPAPAVPQHRHAPGGLEHLQLALVSTLVCLSVAAVLRRVLSAAVASWQAPLLPQWWRPELPGAP